MTLTDIPKLKALIDRIDAWLGQEPEARLVVNALQLQENANYRLSCGTYELRIAGVRATCTAGCHGLLRNWQEAARRAIAKAEAQLQPVRRAAE